ncbi:hypothetical protein P5G60_07860 [Paenibacillus jamilae]|nr:hypothetical protein [Paenibacillus jamilae]
MQSAADLFKRTKKLERYFIEELTVAKIMTNAKSKLLMFGAFLLLLLSFTLSIKYLQEDHIMFVVTVYCSCGVSLFLTIVSVRISHSIAKEKYPGYRSIITNRFFSYDSDFLFAVRSDSLKRKARSLNFTSSDTNFLIDFYSSKSLDLHKKRWWPITIFGLIILPLWNGFVGSTMKEDHSLRILIPISIILYIVILYLNLILKSILLSKAQKYDYLVRIIKTFEVLKLDK